MGYDSSDDACVYKINNDTAIIQTVDFFTPIVDDPYTYGQIAATNSLSDVYAMGGVPTLAMNLLCAPSCLSNATLREILRGGHDKAVEAGCVIAGGHSVEDKEPKYGLCVMGLVHPDRIWRNIGAREGDVLVLTKPLGSGILATGAKAEMVSEEDYRAMVGYMSTLNRAAAEAARQAGGVSACTDITGFGLVGHSYEMASGSGVTLRLYGGSLPIMSGARELAQMGIIPAGAYRNADYVGENLYTSGVSQDIVDVACDPQTSGGLMLALPAENAGELLRILPDAVIVGEVCPRGEHLVELV